MADGWLMHEQLWLRVHVHEQPRVHRSSCSRSFINSRRRRSQSSSCSRCKPRKARARCQRLASSLVFLRGADHASTRDTTQRVRAAPRRTSAPAKARWRATRSLLDFASRLLLEASLLSARVQRKSR